MEEFGLCGRTELSTIKCVVRKKRSDTPRRPRTNSVPIPNSYDFLPCDHNTISSCKRNRNDNEGFGDGDAFSRNGNEKKLKKVKLKLGGVTRTIHTNSTSGFDPHRVPSNSYYSSDAPQSPNIQGLKSDNVRKSKRIPKIRVLDVGFSDGDEEDEEIRYLGRLNASKLNTSYQDYRNENWKQHRNTNTFKGKVINGSSMVGKYNRVKPRSEKAYADEDYMAEEEPLSDDEAEVERNTLKKESVDLLRGSKEMTLAIIDKSVNHSFEDNFSRATDTVEPPNGSLLAPRKKQKEKLSEVELQLKKAEAAQRRRLQSEKAAREAEAEAIRKILGQDSARKKREEKMKKQREEAAQEKAAEFMKLAPGTVRWVMGPTGTIVSFSEDLGLPSIFNSQPCSYPPAREKCVGPNCTNSYKYRDSKSKLPLCSLLCYRAIHKESRPLTAC